MKNTLTNSEDKSTASGTPSNSGSVEPELLANRRPFFASECLPLSKSHFLFLFTSSTEAMNVAENRAQRLSLGDTYRSAQTHKEVGS